MKKSLIIIGLCLAMVAGFLYMDQVSAAKTSQSAIDQLNAGAGSAGYGDNVDQAADPRIIASRLIMYFVGTLGIVVTYLFVLSGYYFVSSHGNEEKISKARKMMQGAIIGLIIVLLSYSIAYFVGRTAQEVLDLETTGSPQQYK